MRISTLPTHRPFSPPSLLLAASALVVLGTACAAGYRVSQQGDVLVARVSIDTLIGGGLLFLAPLLIGIFYNAILRKLTGEEDQEFFSLGRILFIAIAGFVFVQLLYPLLIWSIRVEPEGLRQVTKEEEIYIPFDRMVAVRNNINRTHATPDGIVPAPRLEVVGLDDKVIYIEEEKVGREVYHRITQEVGQRYYGQDQLLKIPEKLDGKAEEKNEDKAAENAAGESSESKEPLK